MKAKTLAPLPPGPKSRYPLQNLMGFRRDSLSYLRELAETYGDIAHFKLGPLGVVYVHHPDYIKQVLSTQHSKLVKGRPLEMIKELLGDGLLTSEGSLHKRHSRVIQPAFHRKMLDTYAPAMTALTKRMMNRWQEGAQIDMLDEMIKLSTGIAGMTMFNVDIEEEAPDLNQALESIMDLFGRITLPGAEFLLKLPLPGTLRFFRAKERLDQTIYQIIRERRQNRLHNGDLLSLLLAAQDDTSDGGGMTDAEIRDEALTLFLTAFDTTSLALTWTFYLLSQHPEVEAELRQELNQVLEGRMPTLADYPKLTYTRKVFGEAMRLYPPIYVIARQAKEDFQLGDYQVPAGSIVLVSPYLMQRDGRYYDQPNAFSPATFEERTSGQEAKYTYFPFGGGPRSCIGQHYAWLEGVLVLAAVAQHWQVELPKGHQVEIEQLLNLRPKGGMPMILRPRGK